MLIIGVKRKISRHFLIIYYKFEQADDEFKNTVKLSQKIGETIRV